MAAISGTAGLRPALSALRRGGALALANKECLVCAGKAFLGEAARTGAEVLPVDSEHNAVAQALGSGRTDDVTRITLTASGGPFRQASVAEMGRVTPEQALKHPTWSMGRKISVDSATLMNKGLELIEAHHLFGVDPTRLDVVIHPQSVVHGLVTWRDGAVTAGLAPADMRVPIAHCLAWPERIDTDVRPLDLARIGTLSFEPVDHVRFPAVSLAQDALRQGGGAPTVLNAANEVAVAAFLAGELPFLGIVRLVADMLEESVRRGLVREPASVEEALELDAEVRRAARGHLPVVALRVH
jgi:1-deoxy-D-xylulose-5-phosphate reductoisomerase